MAVIKVERALLIRSIGERIRKLNEKYQKALAEHPEKVERFCKLVIPQAEHFIERLKKGDTSKINRTYNGTIEIKFTGDMPDKPTMPGEICRLKGDLERLRMSAELTIRLRDNDKMLSYLDGDSCGR